MPVDAQTQALLNYLHSIHYSMTRGLTPGQARDALNTLYAQLGKPELEPVAHVQDRLIPGPEGDIPIRIYTPQGRGPFPILVDFHGGGFVLGDLDGEDLTCRKLANRAACLVVSVDYPLAPEHPFPAAPEACYVAVQWVAANAPSFNGDATRLAVAGTSAGGNLAAVVAHMARDRGGPRICFQLLLVPAIDLRMPNAPSLEEYGEGGYAATREDLTWFNQLYLGSKEEAHNPLASPVLAATLAGLPPALITTAEYDPLRDDGEQYGNLLQQAGVPVTISRRPGAIHSFVVPNQRGPVLDEAAAALRTAFNPESLTSG
jgi:acetyl esterase